jgi:enoyl-CoA hydratase/carnithine racemase
MIMTQAALHRFETLHLEHREGVDWLTLNRPDRFNAVSRTMVDDLLRYFDALLFDHGVRAVVLQGAGKHFCAGLDLDDMVAITANPASTARTQRAYSELIMAMRHCPQPIIALINGAAVGAGFAIALAADVRYAAEPARVSVAMAKIGLTGTDMGISYFLPRAVGSSNASELMMGGRFADAQKMLRIGLVSEVVPLADLEATGMKLADEMLAMSPLGLRLTKEGINMAQDAGSLEAAIALEDRGQVLCLLPNMQEGASAFLEKRPARYSDA